MRAFRVGLAVAMLVLVVERARADDNDGPLAKGFTTTAQELLDDGAHPVYYVPFEAAPGVEPSTIDFRKARVAIGGVYDQALTDAFEPSLDVSTGRPRLAIKIDFARVTRPATYAVELVLIGKPAAAATDADAGVVAAPVRQTITLQFTHPGATLRPTGTWIVWRTHGLFGDDTEPATKPLGETSHRSRIGPVTIRQYDTALNGGEAVSGTLVIGGATEVPPGAVVDATLVLRGHFPIGTTTGQIEIRAPQLADPVVVSYEVRTRLPRWYIVPIFAFAGLLGWFFRVFLKQREEASSLRVQADDVRARLDDERTGHPVGDQVVELTAADKAVADALTSGKPDAITAAIAAASTAITTAAASRAQFRSELLAEVRAQGEVLSRRWRLPSQVALTSAQRACSLAEQQALAGQLVDAGAARLDARKAIADLQIDANKWADQVGAAVKSLSVPSVPEWKPAADALATALAAIPHHDPSVTAKAELFLPAVHAANAAVLGALPELARGLRAVGDQLAAMLGTSAGAQRQAELVERAVAIDDGAIANDATVGLAVIAAAVRALTAAVKDAIAALYPQADAAVVEELLAAGAYVDAIKAARPARPAMGGGEVDISRVERSPSPGSAPRASEGRGGAVPEAGAGAVVVTVAPAPARAVVARRARNLRVLLVAQAARGALSLAISTIGAYLVYSGSFVGTASEIGAIAAVAFTTEFTIEHALEVVGKSAQRPAS